ncbi:MAG: hypothetical protein J0L97_01555 [Alphaproteobacteria bacterium]|nr:hypothetical protein [Alphaproteobacteria bacterium]
MLCRGDIARYLSGLSLFLFLLLPVRALAGAWTLDEKEFLNITTLRAFQADRFTDASGNEFSTPDYDKLALETQLEYGYSPTLTLGAMLNAQHVHQSNALGLNDENYGIGNASLYLRKQIAELEGWVISAQPMVQLPRVGAGYDLPAIGNDDPELEMRLLAGRALFLLSDCDFVNFEAGYRHRFGDASDQVHLEGTLGLRPAPKILLLTQLFVTHSFDLDYASLPTDPSTDRDYRTVTAQLSAVFEVSPSLSLQLGVFHDLYVRNTGEGTGLIFSTWVRF